jgi:Holliday junction resolvase RusA-like endonuclease
MITIEVFGNPVPQGRPRFARVGKFVKTYDPKESAAWKDSIKLQAIDGALRLKCEFHLSRPPSVSVKKRPHPIVKPDLDNLLKAVKDALKGIVWVDDSQVVELEATKRYSDRPGVLIIVADHAEPEKREVGR